MNRDNATMSTNESHDPNQRFHSDERIHCVCIYNSTNLFAKITKPFFVFKPIWYIDKIFVWFTKYDLKLL